MLPDVSHIDTVFIEEVLRHGTIADACRVVKQLSLAEPTFSLLCSVKVIATDKNRQIVHVTELFRRNDTVTSTALASTSCTTRPMDKQLHFRWEVIMNDVFKKWDIDTTSCQICDKKYSTQLLSESEQTILTSSLIHGTEDEVRAKPSSDT